MYLFMFLRPAPKTQSTTHERALEIVSGAHCWCNLHYISSRSPSQGSRRPPWASKGRLSAKKQRPDLSFYPPQGLPRLRKSWISRSTCEAAAPSKPWPRSRSQVASSRFLASGGERDRASPEALQKTPPLKTSDPPAGSSSDISGNNSRPARPG
jgi:hypothetical protein